MFAFDWHTGYSCGSGGRREWYVSLPGRPPHLLGGPHGPMELYDVT